MQIETIALEEREGFALDFDKLDAKLHGNELVYLCNPNNPTGRAARCQGIDEE